jgi:5-deoxy-glucuronate isomerase
VPDREPATLSERHRRAGSLARPPWSLDLTQAEAAWSWSSLRVLDLRPNGCHRFDTGDEEVLVLPLAGSCLVSCGDVAHTLAGRAGVFDGPTDFCYVPPGSDVLVTSPAGGRFAVPGARAEGRWPLRYQPAQRVAVELRGAGSCSRQVVNFCMPPSFDADRLIVCEVLTPAGNWSSYPPHKHDETNPNETELEEIYYFEVDKGPAGQEGMAYQRVYGTPSRPIDVLAEVRTGDVVTVPHGYHGPSMAVPGYHLYYLNVMAGPGERAWLATDDPAHAWVRATWAGQIVDPRLATSLAGPDSQRAGGYGGTA